MEQQKLLKYAELIAARGANVQKGQEVFIVAGLDQPEFTAMVTEACYRRGAKRVVVDWDCPELTKLDSKYCTLKTLSIFEDYVEARWQHYVKTFPCRIYLDSKDPDSMKGANMTKITKALQKKYPQIKKYRDQLENRYQWCIAGVPGVKWARKVFPKAKTDGEAVERLWGSILTASRADDDPLAAWDEHNAELKKHCTQLNSMHIRSLHYTAGNGTDLTVGMIPEGVFCGGTETSLQNIVFNPNIPSEECFISPMKGKAEGTVYASMPLSYNGQMIEDFSIRFENGKAVEWHAKKNEKLLEKIITMDEGSAYLGECALVPYDSPIRNTGILFYNTLYDENAACHLALGMGFADCIDGFENRTLQECQELGINDSMVHVDFMIGTEDMSIDAETEDEKTVPVFRNGNWVI